MFYLFIQKQTISHGRAAEILGVHKFDLIDFYASLEMLYRLVAENTASTEYEHL